MCGGIKCVKRVTVVEKKCKDIVLPFVPIAGSHRWAKMKATFIRLVTLVHKVVK